MSQSLRKILIPTFAGFVALALTTSVASAEEFLGKVKSVDVAGKKMVVTETSTNKDAELSVGGSTAWVKEKKGKVSKKFDLSKLKVGSTVEVTREGSLASRVMIKEGKKKKAVK